MPNLLQSPRLTQINNTTPSTFWDVEDQRYNLPPNVGGISLEGTAISGDRLYGNVFNNTSNAFSVNFRDENGVTIQSWVVQANSQVLLDRNITADLNWTITLDSEDIDNIDAWIAPLALPQTPAWPTDPGGSVTLGVKGFASVGDLASNASRNVAMIGELSTYSETFSRDRQLSSGSFKLNPSDSLSEEQGIHQTIFSCSTTAGVSIVVSPVLLEFLEELNAWVYASGMRVEFNNNSETTRQLIVGSWATPLYNLQLGAMVQHEGEYYPESITFELTRASLTEWYENKYNTTLTLSTDYNRSQIKIWYSDRAFKAQYDDYLIEIVPPIDNIDDFFRIASAVRGLVNAVTTPMLMNKVRDKADGDPYTESPALEFDWNDPLTQGNKIKTVWTFVVYGNAGLSVDAIKERLRQWILANSTHTREEWTAIFPDIFRSTEFIFMPMWNRYAIPNMTTAEGVYSPILDYQDALIASGIVICGVGYNTPHLVNRLAFIGNPYKSVALMVCGGPDNRVGAVALNQVWPDYINVPTMSVDFNRMQPSTQAWITTLQRLLRAAEEATEFSEIPVGFSRIRRRNSQNQVVTYIATTVNNIQYMVVTKLSMLALVPVVDYGVTPEDMPLSLLPAPDIMLQTDQGSRELSVDFEAIGGTGPYTYSLEATSAMVQSAIGPATGQCEIEFINFGTYPIRVHVEDSVGNEYIGNYDVNVRV